MPLISRPRHRHARALVALLLAVATLSGCLRYTESVTIAKDDTVSGIVIILSLIHI